MDLDVILMQFYEAGFHFRWQQLAGVRSKCLLLQQEENDHRKSVVGESNEKWRKKKKNKTKKNRID